MLFFCSAAAASCGLPVTFATPSRTVPAALFKREEAEESLIVVFEFVLLDIFSRVCYLYVVDLRIQELVV